MAIILKFIFKLRFPTDAARKFSNGGGGAFNPSSEVCEYEAKGN